MTLYLENPTDVFTQWNPKTRIKGFLLPRNCERVWSEQELSDHDLYKPVDAEVVPEDDRIVSTSVQRVEGVVKHINVTETIPQSEIDAKQQEELDDLVSQLDNGKSLLRALGVEVFKLAKAADPSLTPADFKIRIRNTAENF